MLVTNNPIDLLDLRPTPPTGPRDPLLGPRTGPRVLDPRVGTRRWLREDWDPIDPNTKRSPIDFHPLLSPGVFSPLLFLPHQSLTR